MGGSPFSNLSITSPTSQLILQPFCHFTYITAHSPTLPSLYCTYVTAHSLSLHLRHRPFSNPSFGSPTSKALHLIHLASRPRRKSNKHGSGNAYFLSSAHLFIMAKTKVTNIVRGGSTYHNMKKERQLHMGPETYTFCD